MNKNFWIVIVSTFLILTGIFFIFSKKQDNNEVVFWTLQMNDFAPYINGVIKGAETVENGKKYWFEKKKMATKNDIEAYKILAKRTTSEENRKEYLEKIKSKVKYSYYIPCFSSFKTFMREYKKRHKEIYWITEGAE